MRGRGWAVSLAVVAWAVVLVGGAAAPAGAVQVVDPLPLPPAADPRFDWDAARIQMQAREPASRVPSSTLRAGWTSGPAGTQMRVALARRSIEQTAAKGAVTVASRVGGTAAKFGTVLRGGGTALTAAFVLDMTYSAFAGGYGDGFGFGGLIGYDSEGLWCDLSAVASRPCSPGLVEVANGDVTLGGAPGWTVTPLFGTFVRSDPTYAFAASLGFQMGYAGAFGDVGVPMVLSGTPSGTAQTGVVFFMGMYVDSFQVMPSGQVVSIQHDGSWSGSWDIRALPVRVQNITPAAGNYVDHVTVRIVKPTDLGIGDAVTPETATWYPPGHALRPAEVDPNPARWFRTDWLCEAGGVSTSHSADSANFHELDAEFPEPVSPVCDPGALTHVTVSEMGTGLGTSVLYDWTVPVELEAWAATYPQCSDGSCTLELLRIDPTTANRLACFDNPELCLGWFEDPAKVDNYVCTYGGQDVALAECNLYAPTFDPARWAAEGRAPYADPETGDIPTAAPAALPEQQGGCPPPFSWSAVWNNWWLFKAVDCGVRSAVTALFVPVTLPGKIDNLTAMAQSRTPYPELVSIAAALAPPEGGSLCMVLSLPLTFVLGHDQPLLDSCTWADPVSRFLRDYRVLFAAAVWISVISPLAWWAWRTYAPGASGVA